jgi:hypothetical protein
MKIHQKEVLAEVIAERDRQDRLWGIQDHKPGKWLAILGEEFGESCRAVLEMNPKYREELIQVAAVAIAAVESFDRWIEQKKKEVLSNESDKQKL